MNIKRLEGNIENLLKMEVVEYLPPPPAFKLTDNY